VQRVRPTARSEHTIVRTAFVSTYPPRRCGIASFTSDLGRVIEDREIVALHVPEQASPPYPLEVHHRIRRDEPTDYIRTANALGACVDVVSIQHDFRIWGGPDGEAVLDFVGALDVPAVATLHTIPGEPTDRQRAILAGLVAGVRTAVVMSHSAATVLTETYGVDPARLELIPHGIPDLPLVGPETVKAGLMLEDRPVLLSFGLAGPRKGYELVIDALPAIVARHPTVCYAMVGPTHPDLVRSDGESYRASLVARIARLGLTDNVQFLDRFVGRAELTRWLKSADVVLTPYADLDQVVSGTVSNAMGAGRTIVSTPFTFAADMLADGRGVLVPPGSPEALAAAVNDLLDDGDQRATIGRRAYDHSRPMVWSRVGADYARLFARTVAAA
jgi:glycosyltransferase involved in cell wall biosynthesis